MALKKCWLIVSSRGDSVFLEQHRAEEQIRRYGGILVNMYGQTQSGGTGGGQTGADIVVSPEQLHENPSVADEIRNAGWPVREGLSTC